MILATVRDFVDPGALWRILTVTLLASVLVPVAFAAAITGQARREQAVARGGRDVTGTAMVLIGLLVCLAAVALGIWAMLQK
jgi:hypothetical protein